MENKKIQWAQDLTLEEVKIQFISEVSAEREPSVARLIATYPQWAAELTSFALELKAHESALDSATDIPDIPTRLEARINARLQASRKPANTLNDARKALDWTPDDLANKLNLPTRIVISLSRGLIVNWPQKLELKLSAALLRPVEHINMLLRNSVATPAANFSAEGPIRTSTAQPVSFEDALKECESRHELSHEQKDEWLNND